MKELDIPAERILRHYDASRKNCPASMSENNWAKWSDFKKELMEDEKMKNAFKDIEGHFAKQDIEDLYKMGIISGTTDTSFAPDEPAKRGEMARIARNIIRYITGE